MSDQTAPQQMSRLSQKAHRKAIGLAVSAAVGGFLFGFDSSVINGAVDAIEKRFAISAAVTGFVVAIALLGCALGAWLSGRFADRWGRTKVMVAAAVVFFISSVMAAFAFSSWDLALWRFMAGVGIGIASAVVPAYIAEIAPAAMRGRLASLQQLAITLGIFAALLSDQVLAHLPHPAATPLAAGTILGLAAWRWMFLVCIIPATVYGVLAWRMPESPRYLMAKGEVGKAREVLAEVIGDPAEVQRQFTEIENAIGADLDLAGAKHPLRENRPGRHGFLGLRRIVWIGIGLSVFQQFVGINVIFYYSTTLWSAVGFTESDAFMISTLTSVTNVVVTFVAIALVDKIGRKPLLLIGSAGMTVSLAAMALAFLQSTVGTDGSRVLPSGSAWGLIALVAANLFVVFFGATWGPVVWVLLGEMFPNAIRAAALGVAAAFQWIANFAITMTFPPILAGPGPSFAYFMYAAFAALSFFFVLALVRETKGRQLEEMSDG
ncbi:MAG: sugar porter family MFS transporter [Promicromonosporaceae bacterium]|nr:sugar porter family MFS transporter [Promicromonosporaceae bacterium]